MQLRAGPDSRCRAALRGCAGAGDTSWARGTYRRQRGDTSGERGTYRGRGGTPRGHRGDTSGERGTPCGQREDTSGELAGAGDTSGQREDTLGSGGTPRKHLGTPRGGHLAGSGGSSPTPAAGSLRLPPAAGHPRWTERRDLPAPSWAGRLRELSWAYEKSHFCSGCALTET